MGEKRIHFINEFDWIRTGLMFEPHGHDIMSGSFFYDPDNKDNDLAVLFIETSGCLPMCGHGLIGTLTILLEESLISPNQKGILNVETPAGLVRCSYKQEGTKINEIKYKVDINSLHRNEEDKEIKCNDIARISLRITQPIFYDEYNTNRNTGSVILIDEGTYSTVGAGMII